MLQKLRSRAEEEKGFTLIELLVVIIIIAILAAIAIPAFLNQREKGYDASAKSNLKTAQTAEETYATDNGGNYTATASDLTTIEPALKNGPAVTPALQSGGYVLTATSQGANGVTYTLGVASGVITKTCSKASTGGCNAASAW